MLKKLYLTTAALIFISACASNIVDETIPLSDEFEENSELLVLKEPFLKISGSSFNQEFGKYSIANTKAPWRSNDTTLVNVEKDSNFINYLLFDDALTVIKEEFDIEGSQWFSFDLLENKQLISSSRCEIFSLSYGEKSFSSDSSQEESDDASIIDSRQKTYLFCAINRNGESVELSLYANQDEPMEVFLDGNTKLYDAQEISQEISLVKGEKGIDRISLPSWATNKTGIEFWEKDQRVSAISFVGKPKIWLNNDLSDDNKELFVAVNASLTLFNWLDDEWRPN